MDNIDNSAEISKSTVSFDEKMMKYLKPILGQLKREEIKNIFYVLQNKAKDSKAPDFLAFWGYLYSYIKNYKEAIKWLLKSNDIYPHHQIQYQIGLLYLEGGYGIEQDIPKAVDFFLESAKKGYIEALYKLGCIYRDGIGFDQSYEQAIEYFKLLVDKHSEAMYEFALLYYCGLGIEKNIEEAKRLFYKSSNNGNVKAKIVLSLIGE